MNKKILIAIPTNKYIEPETFKAIYDLRVPDGYETEFQYFYGYCVDQVRNLICHWAERYDYLFSVDSDISFTNDTLEKLLAHDKDVVSGLYIQRIPNTHTLEIYRQGRNVPYSDIKDRGLVEIDGCGFGCVLVKSEVIRKIGYPQFVYKSAIDHKNTVSEDVYFCLKAKEHGFKIWADTSILCRHHGATIYEVKQ
jgi:GT2 family glycosyltransferase